MYAAPVIPADILQDLPERVVNELAILEDRAIRAETSLARREERVHDLVIEVNKLRTEMMEMTDLAQGLQEAAQNLAIAAEAESTKIEGQLRRLLVLQAS